eukprot:m.24039 g.24039  ORF g.24039 m.24039 type:complete len:290 (-) comp35785_c0_seq1:356-1225(-)
MAEVTLKVLVPNYAAGAIIGKAGATITQLQADTGAHIKLSQNKDFFPGTTERVLVLTGTAESVHAAVDSLIGRVAALPEPPAQYHSEPRSEVRSQQAKLVVPYHGVGILIGKGGENIKALQASAAPAKIRISSKESDFGTNERIVTVFGTTEQLKAVSKTLIEKLTSEEGLLDYDDPSASYSFALDYDTPPRGAQAAPSHGASTTPITISIPVADNLVGAILGKGGRAIYDIQAQSGATVVVSPKGEFAPGTTNRTLSITGLSHNAHSALKMVERRIDAAVAQSQEPRA